MTRPKRTASASVREFMGIRELADMLDVSTSTVYKLLEKNQLPHLRVRSAIRIQRAAVEAYIASNLTGQAQ